MDSDDDLENFLGGLGLEGDVDAYWLKLYEKGIATKTDLKNEVKVMQNLFDFGLEHQEDNKKIYLALELPSVSDDAGDGVLEGVATQGGLPTTNQFENNSGVEAQLEGRSLGINVGSSESHLDRDAYHEKKEEDSEGETMEEVLDHYFSNRIQQNVHVQHTPTLQMDLQDQNTQLDHLGEQMDQNTQMDHLGEQMNTLHIEEQQEEVAEDLEKIEEEEEEEDIKELLAPVTKEMKFKNFLKRGSIQVRNFELPPPKLALSDLFPFEQFEESDFRPVSADKEEIEPEEAERIKMEVLFEQYKKANTTKKKRETLFAISKLTEQDEILDMDEKELEELMDELIPKKKSTPSSTATPKTDKPVSFIPLMSLSSPRGGSSKTNIILSPRRTENNSEVRRPNDTELEVTPQPLPTHSRNKNRQSHNLDNIVIPPNLQPLSASGSTKTTQSPTLDNIIEDDSEQPQQPQQPQPQQSTNLEKEVAPLQSTNPTETAKIEPPPKAAQPNVRDICVPIQGKGIEGVKLVETNASIKAQVDALKALAAIQTAKGGNKYGNEFIIQVLDPVKVGAGKATRVVYLLKVPHISSIHSHSPQ
eukprot:TRINITY_DN1983_c0_g1_i11.p1 TRINITY_DN1983_c0_g1~~TRINITY_DN1983_c0_g1_i11.p1  ORF type:complete len:588 (-),score=215.46 TRINITY_DN1983_c0_g1_i11:959-2722(-)